MKNNYNPLLKLLALLNADVSIDEKTDDIIIKIPYDKYLLYEKMWSEMQNEKPKI